MQGNGNPKRCGRPHFECIASHLILQRAWTDEVHETIETNTEKWSNPLEKLNSSPNRAYPLFYQDCRVSLEPWPQLERTITLATTGTLCSYYVLDQIGDIVEELYINRSCQFYILRTTAREEPAVSYRWTGRVWEITGWSSRLRENYRPF